MMPKLLDADLYKPVKEWVELTDVELSLLAEKYTGADGLDVVDYGRAVMKAYRERLNDTPPNADA